MYYRCSLPMLLYTFRSPPHTYLFSRTKFLTIGSFSNVYNTSRNIWLIFTTRNVNDPYLFTFDINRIKLTSQCRRNFTNRILNGRTFIVINLCANNLIIIINSDKNITTSCIGKARNLIGDFLNLRRHTTFEVHIIAFASFHKFLYL